MPRFSSSSPFFYPLFCLAINVLYRSPSSISPLSNFSKQFKIQLEISKMEAIINHQNTVIFVINTSYFVVQDRLAFPFHPIPIQTHTCSENLKYKVYTVRHKDRLHHFIKRASVLMNFTPSHLNRVLQQSVKIEKPKERLREKE